MLETELRGDKQGAVKSELSIMHER
jgi:hypothetical protein